MKTFGRILMIVTAFVVVMSLTYITVNASGSTSTSVRAFNDGGPDRPQSQDGGFSVLGLVFELIKNIAIVGFIVALIVYPKNLAQQKRRAVPVRVE